MKIAQSLLVLLGAALGACNAAMSEHPLFGEAQRSANLKLEDGLWYEVRGNCITNEVLPKDQWPKCAEWVILKNNRAIANSDRDAGEEPLDIFIIDGTPPIIQVKTKSDGAKTVYGYLVLGAAAYSPARKVSTVNLWFVPCGTEEGRGGSNPQIRPFPGFNKDCMTTSAEAVRAAAARARSPGPEVVRWKWVRAEAP